MRLAGVADLNVQAVLSYYGPPDLSDWLEYHHGDRYYRWVAGHVDFDPGIIDLLSGVSHSHSYIVDCLGEHDHNVASAMSTASFDRDYPDGHVDYYNGPHGVSLYADDAAFHDFLSHL